MWKDGGGRGCKETRKGLFSLSVDVEGKCVTHGIGNLCPAVVRLIFLPPDTCFFSAHNHFTFSVAIFAFYFSCINSASSAMTFWHALWALSTHLVCEAVHCPFFIKRCNNVLQQFVKTQLLCAASISCEICVSYKKAL